MAQSQMASFLAAVAQAGAQVIIESHSDHILNGLRRAVKGGQLSHEALAIHFFEGRDPITQEALVKNLKVNEKGQINPWPKHFFDQFDQDLSELVSWE